MQAGLRRLSWSQRLCEKNRGQKIIEGMRIIKKGSQYLHRLASLPERGARRDLPSGLDLPCQGDNSQGHLLLDIGCGLGDRTLLYSAAGSHHVIGVEIAPVRAAIAHRQAVEAEALVSIVVADAAALPFVADSFHCIVSNDTWEHLARPVQVLQECCRVLQSAGVLTISALPITRPGVLMPGTGCRFPGCKYSSRVIFFFA